MDYATNKVFKKLTAIGLTDRQAGRALDIVLGSLAVGWKFKPEFYVGEGEIEQGFVDLDNLDDE